MIFHNQYVTQSLLSPTVKEFLKISQHLPAEVMGMNQMSCFLSHGVEVLQFISNNFAVSVVLIEVCVLLTVNLTTTNIIINHPHHHPQTILDFNARRLMAKAKLQDVQI